MENTNKFINFLENEYKPFDACNRINLIINPILAIGMVYIMHKYIFHLRLSLFNPIFKDEVQRNRQGA